MSELQKVLLIFVLSLLPTFEGRYAVIVGIKILNPITAIIVASIASCCLSIALAYAIQYIDRLFMKFRESSYGVLKKVSSLYLSYLDRIRRKARPYVERYGVLGLALFVAIPLPATGIWTGALVAYIFGFKREHALLALLLGGLLSIALTSSITILATGTLFR